MDLSALARDQLGLDELRPGQLEVAEAIVAGRDALAVMATGYGKSAIYQLAGLAIDGPTLVVSPLIALQRDQVESLEIHGAAAISSVVPEWERDDALKNAGEEIEFLFMAPEQLANPEMLEKVKAAQPSLMVVDEAHCISEWGHDFRPEYLRLGQVAEALGHPPVLALTATASPPVREEIVARLGLRDPLVSDPRLRPAEPAFRRRALLRRAGQGARADRARRRAREAGDRLHRHPRRRRADRRRPGGRRPAQRRLPRRHGGRDPR